ncbi:MAG: glycosyltransferase family 4 protein [Candidatus Poribacteria bacterium]|nr:glycosyltransferase family 4 protein [Candidatus Poribacteria bacterium]
MKRTILNVSQNYHVRGGSDRYFFTLAELLQKHGHRVVPFTAASPNNEPSEWEGYFPRGADFEHPGAGDLLRFLYSHDAVKSIRQLLKATDIDLAHFHIYYGKLTTSILEVLKRDGISLIQTLHEYKLTCPVYSHLSNDQICEACEGKHFWRALPKRCNRGSLARTALSVTESYISKMLGAVKKFDHFISVSHFLRKKMISHGIPEDKISTVHNFVDVSDITPNFSEGDYILYFGRVHRSKGILTLIEAAVPLTDVPIYIVGDGEAMPEVQQIIEQNGCKHIHLLGFKQGDELRELILNSICTVLPSEWYENCPMSVLESYAYGKPVIGADIGGIPELIVDGVDGCLVPSGEQETLRDRLLWMSEHKSDAAEMGRIGRYKMETEFNADIHYERIMNVYQQFL